MLGNVIAVGFALASAIVIAWGTVVRHRIAADAQTKVMSTALSTPLWWIGTGAAVVAYALQLIALSFGSLLVVQPILVLSLMFTLPLAAWYSKRRMPPAEIAWSVALTIAVGIMVAYGRPLQGDPHPDWNQWWPALLAGLVLLASLTLAAIGRPDQRALALGTMCGVIYGYVALLAKAVVELATLSGPLAILHSWEFYLFVLLTGTGTVVQQYSFHAGALASSLPAMTIMEPIVAFALGYWVLGEQFQVSTAGGWIVMACALAVMVLATITLSRVPASARATVLNS